MGCENKKVSTQERKGGEKCEERKHGMKNKKKTGRK